MSGITKRQIQLLRVAQGKLDISDGAYRTMLAEIAGVTSTTELVLSNPWLPRQKGAAAPHRKLRGSGGGGVVRSLVLQDRGRV